MKAWVKVSALGAVAAFILAMCFKGRLSKNKRA